MATADLRTLAPISTMKVKVHCCKSCQRKAKKILEQADGVQTICLETGEGLLTVTGDVEPFPLIDMMEKGVGKKVELWSFNRFAVSGSTEDDGDDDGHHDALKEADLSKKMDRKKAAAHWRADGERERHAIPAPAACPCWLEPGRYHPMDAPRRHHREPGQPPFWSPYGQPPPDTYGMQQQFPPPYYWNNPMPPPPMQPPPPPYY